jgi:hypothetical protein
MSRKLLVNLNGNNNGKFNQWLKEFKGEPRIAWYPSAGEDFRDLLYLHPDYSRKNPASKPDPQAPDIFLHTDYFPWSTSTFLDSRIIHIDDRTSVTVKSIEELPRCDLPLDEKSVDFPQGSHATGKVLFLEVDINSNVLGNFSAAVVYAFVENSVFCAERILPQGSVFSHIVHVRYGGGLGGGGRSSGVWLLNILGQLQCECYVTDSHHTRQSGDERTYTLYPALAGAEDESQLEKIRIIKSEEWSGHGDVSWNIVRPT